jgi:hypothetical protein
MTVALHFFTSAVGTADGDRYHEIPFLSPFL